MSRRTGSTDLPLHAGWVPAWLGLRMARLGRVIKRLCNPRNVVLACVLQKARSRQRCDGQGGPAHRMPCEAETAGKRGNGGRH